MAELNDKFIIANGIQNCINFSGLDIFHKKALHTSSMKGFFL